MKIVAGNVASLLCIAAGIALNVMDARTSRPLSISGMVGIVCIDLACVIGIAAFLRFAWLAEASDAPR